MSSSGASMTNSTSDLPSSSSEKEKDERIFQPGFDIPDADLILSSKEGHLFKVPSIILRTSSEFFKTVLTLPQAESKHVHVQATIDLDEPTRVVDTMLRIVCCIGLDNNTTLQSFEDLSALLSAAEKYDMAGVISFARALVLNPRFLKDPLQVYSLSCRYGWKDETQHAAQLSLALNLAEEGHHTALRNITSFALFDLMNLRWRRKAELRECLDSEEIFYANRVPFICSQQCATETDVAHWRELKWEILDNFDRDASGDSIRSLAFTQWKSATALFAMTCKSCKRILFNKDSTVKTVLDKIDGLPLLI